MNVDEMVTELGASLGNRTDLTATRFVQWLNWAQYDLCGFHQKRLFPPIRFHELEQEAIITTTVDAGTCDAVGAARTIQFQSGVAQAAVDYYNEMVVEITGYDGTAPSGLVGQKRLIVDYAGSVGSYIATISEDWDVNPDASTEYKIYQKKYDLVTHLSLNVRDEIWAIERMEDAAEGDQIAQQDWQDIINTAFTDTGDPSKFSHRGNAIIFDMTPDSEKYYRMYMYYYPTPLTTVNMDSQYSVLPNYWHEAIVAGAVFRGFGKLMEPEREDDARGKYVEEVVRSRSSFEIEHANIRKGLKVKFS